jgi:Protein of unknown function (DUF732)
MNIVDGLRDASATPSRSAFRPFRGLARRALYPLVAALAVLPVCAAPASADTDGYLHAVGDQYRFLTPQQLLGAGHRACSIIDSGNPATVAIDMLNREQGISVPVAFNIVTKAIIHLGC